MLFPLFFNYKWRSRDRSTTLVAPPLYIGQHKGDRRWFEAGLLLWHFRTPAKVTTIVLPPIFGHQHAYAERRLTWVAPLFVRDNRMGKDEAWTALPPLAYVQHRKGPKNVAIQFPLLWHFTNERKASQTTIGGLLWYDVRRKGRKTQLVPGVFLHREDEKGSLNVVGPALAWWSKNDPEKAIPGRHWRVLFGLFGGGNEGGERYFTLFGAKIKLKPKPLPKRLQAKPKLAPKAAQPANKKEARRRQRERNERIERQVQGLEI